VDSEDKPPQKIQIGRGRKKLKKKVDLKQAVESILVANSQRAEKKYTDVVEDGFDSDVTVIMGGNSSSGNDRKEKDLQPDKNGNF